MVRASRFWGVLLFIVASIPAPASTLVVDSELTRLSFGKGKGGWSNYKFACTERVIRQQMAERGVEGFDVTRLREPAVLSFSKVWEFTGIDTKGVEVEGDAWIDGEHIVVDGVRLGYRCWGSKARGQGGPTYVEERGHFALLLAPHLFGNAMRLDSNLAGFKRACIRDELEFLLAMDGMAEARIAGWRHGTLLNRHRLVYKVEFESELIYDSTYLRVQEIVHRGETVGVLCY